MTVPDKFDLPGINGADDTKMDQAACNMGKVGQDKGLGHPWCFSAFSRGTISGLK